MLESESRELRDIIMKGLDASFAKMLSEKKKDNKEIAIIEDGEVVNVKATDI